jgi:hypothetical protein
MLVLHIGLPKTATTFLQYKIFKRAEGVGFVHRSGGGEAEALCAELRKFAAAKSPKSTEHRRRLGEMLAARARPAPPRCLLVTDENVSVNATDFWKGKGAEPARLARRLGNLRRDLRESYPVLKVILGIRRQDQWLGSRYAESSKNFPGFGQADFERRMREIAAAETLDGPLAWLDYAAVREAFTAALGARNFLMLPMERLTEDPRAALRETGDFLGGIDLVARYAAAEAKGEGLRRNTLSAGEGVWALRSGKEEIRLDPGLAEALRARFAGSGAALAEAAAPGPA